MKKQRKGGRRKGSKNDSQRSYAMTCTEVAAVLGIDRSTVHRIERQALKKLRAAFKARGITAVSCVFGGDAMEDHTAGRAWRAASQA